MHVQDQPRAGKVAPSPSPLLLYCLGCMLLFSASGCGSFGDASSGDHAGQLNGKFQIEPAIATVTPGQTFHFSASSPWGSGATWSVQPTSGGTIDAVGNFSASSALGNYVVVAIWKGDVRYTATAAVTVTASLSPAIISPKLVLASGLPQTSASGSIRNAPVVGESVPSTHSANPTGAVQVRHGFEPPVSR